MKGTNDTVCEHNVIYDMASFYYIPCAHSYEPILVDQLVRILISG